MDYLDQLVTFQCPAGYYNQVRIITCVSLDTTSSTYFLEIFQVASLYFTSSDNAMQQLYHFQEFGGTNYTTFDTAALLLFFIPYFFMATITAGTLCPAGLFVPTLLAGMYCPVYGLYV